jgi:hypothetical protein
MLKKFTYEKEIEHLKCQPLDEKISTIIEYMSKELDKINERYGNEPGRD